MTNSFLPPESQPWGREVEARLRALELQDSATNAAINGINATLSATQQALRQVSQQQAALSAQQDALAAVVARQGESLSVTASSYTIPVSTGLKTPFEFTPPQWATGGLVTLSVEATAVSGAYYAPARVRFFTTSSVMTFPPEELPFALEIIEGGAPTYIRTVTSNPTCVLLAGSNAIRVYPHVTVAAGPPPTGTMPYNLVCSINWF